MPVSAFGEPAVVRRFMPAYDVARVVRIDAIVFVFITPFRFVSQLIVRVACPGNRHYTWVCIYASLALAKVRQLAMFLMFPPRMALDWSVQSMHDPRHPSWYGFQSEMPLMGGAVFDLRLPRRASGLYVGVRDWHQGPGRQFVPPRLYSFCGPE